MRNVSWIGMSVLAVAVMATAAAAGCTRVALRTESSTSGIRAAEEVGAARVPQAKLHLQLAKEELATAKQFAASDEKEKAESMLQRSEADSELAVALTRAEAEKNAANAAWENVRQLRDSNK